MKSLKVSIRVVAAIAIAATGVVALHAQPPQGGPAGAPAQSTANVNVVNVPTVTVGNSAAQPIPVSGPAKEPVYASFDGTVPVSIGLQTLGTYPVPAGKRLVVEHFSAACRSINQNDVRAQLVHGDVTLTFLPLTSVPLLNFPGQVTGSGAVPVSAYIDEGTVSLQVVRTSTDGNTFCTATMLGYLTPLS